jgi:hypothetical protein
MTNKKIMIMVRALCLFDQTQSFLLTSLMLIGLQLHSHGKCMLIKLLNLCCSLCYQIATGWHKPYQYRRQQLCRLDVRGDCIS